MTYTVLTQEQANRFYSTTYEAGGRDETTLQALSDAGGRSTPESLAVDIGWNSGVPAVTTSLRACLIDGYVTSLPGGLWEITTEGENVLPA